MQARTYVMKHLFLPLLALLALVGSAGCRTAHHAPAIPPPDTLTAATPAATPQPLPATAVDVALLPDSTAPTEAEADSMEEVDDADLSLPERLRKLLDNDIFSRTQVGIYVYDLTADSALFMHNERQCMRPASNMKLVTAITALSVLGTQHEYRTTFGLQGSQADSLWQGSLYVHAGYDPLLDADDLRALTDSLRARGIKALGGRVVTDLSMKDDTRMGWGWCWDDDEVPTTPLLYDNRDRFAQALRQALAEAGIAFDGTVSEGTMPHSLDTLCTRRHSLDAVLLPMMKRSDNSMAESVFYQIAAHSGKPRASRKEAAAAVHNLVRQLGLDPSHYQVADGSGLSLYNYVTPQLLGRLLRYAYAHDAIYRHLLPTLPVAGVDGTLRKRMQGTAAQHNVRAKTGTVEGVSTLSGYCTAANGHTLCFSIMNQGIRHTSTGRNFQDRVCRALCR